MNLRAAVGRLVAALAVLVFLASAEMAQAHASLPATEPDGAVVETAPRTLSLSFDEAVRPLVARLMGPGSRNPPKSSGHAGFSA